MVQEGISLSSFLFLSLHVYMYIYTDLRSLPCMWIVEFFRMAKLREEADPYSRDFGTLDKGSIVKVLEVRPPQGAGQDRVPSCRRVSLALHNISALLSLFLVQFEVLDILVIFFSFHVVQLLLSTLNLLCILFTPRLILF